MFRFNLLVAAILLFIVFVDENSYSKAMLPELLTETEIISKPISTEVTSSIPPEPEPLTVSASIYYPVPEQTDDTPFITADGSVINEKNPRGHRWIALSRDLLSRWGGDINYGDKVVVSGISKQLDGHYIVRDTMHQRIKNRIDILVGRHDNIMGFWENVQIAKVD